MKDRMQVLILIEFDEDEGIVVWVGSHLEYDRTFKGNKATIQKWLRNQQLIQNGKIIYK